MILRVGSRRIISRASGLTLGEQLGTDADAVDVCVVNGAILRDWRQYTPLDNDIISIEPRAGWWTFVLPAILSALINAVLNMLISLLMPKPKKPNTPKREGERSGISGLSNTIEEGTPIVVVHGRRRVWPHLIASRNDVSEDGKTMTVSVLGLLGDSGGDGYESISDGEINDIKLANYPEVTMVTRLGTAAQTVIPEFENVPQLFGDGRQIKGLAEIQSVEISGTPTADSYTLEVPTYGVSGAIAYNATAADVQTALRLIDGALSSITVSSEGISPNVIFTVVFVGVAGNVGTMKVVDSLTPRQARIRVATVQDGSEASGTPISYTTHGPVDRVKIVLSAPVFMTKTGGRATMTFKIERKKTSEGAGAWVEIPESPIEWKDKSSASLWKLIQTDLPSKDTWDFRFTMLKSNNFGVQAQLFNVEEIQFTTLNYGGYALVALLNISMHQIQSLDSMRWSFVVDGHKCEWPDGLGGYVHEWTRKRARIARCILTHPTLGLGHRISKAMFDDAVAQDDVQDYLDESVTAQGGGTEARGYCDHILAQRLPALDHLRDDLLGEGRLSLISSGRKLKLIVDKPKTPNLLWSYPGNIATGEGGAVKRHIGYEDQKIINTVRGTFYDEANNYKTATLEISVSDIGSDPKIAEDYVFDTLCRESEVSRELDILLKRSVFTTAAFNFKAAASAQGVEPLDCDNLSIDTIDHEFGWQGRAPGGCTTTVFYFPSGMKVTIAPAKTYELLVQRAADNVVETRVASTGAGNWGKITLTSAFSIAPARGDFFMFGEQNVAKVPATCTGIKLGDDGLVETSWREYIAAIFDPETLPTKIRPRPILIEPLPPIPLWDAQVTQQLYQQFDGAWVGTLHFDVTPGLPVLGGKAQGGAAGFITLSADSPALDNYFMTNNARIYLIAGTGSGQDRKITSYTGSDRHAVPDTNFSPAPDSTTQYQIERERFGVFEGFVIEIGRELTDDFATLTRVKGIHHEIGGKEFGLTEVYRIRPYSIEGAEQITAQWIRQVTIGGDTEAPDPPTNLVLTPKPGMMVVDVDDNTELDLQEYRFYRGTTAVFADAVKIGESAVSKFIDVSGVATTEYWYWATAKDRSGNESTESNSDNDFFIAGVNGNPAEDPPAPTKIAQGVYLSGDGTVFAYFDIQLPALPDNTAFLNVLLRQDATKEWQIVGQVDTSGQVIRIDDLVPGRSYYVAIQAFSGGAVGSNVISATGSPFIAPGDTTAPAAPTGLTASAHPGATELKCDANTEADLAEYRFYRNTSDVFGTATEIGQNSTPIFWDFSGTGGQQYFYWVKAEDWSENLSPESTSASATFSAAATTDPPVDPGAASKTGEGSYLSGDGTVLGYLDILLPAKPTGAVLLVVHYKPTAASKYQIAAQLTEGAVTVRIDDLTPGRQYDVAVQAFSSGNGASAIVAATASPFTVPGDVTAPATPTGMGIVSKPGHIRISCTAATEADFSEYEVYRNTTNDPGTATKIADVQSNVYLDSTGSGGVTYWYWFKAVDFSENASGFSSQVNTVFQDAIQTITPNNPGAATKSGEGTYLSADGTALAYFDIQLPASFPAGALYMNLLYKPTASAQYLIGGQFDFAASEVVRLDDLTPGRQYNVALQAWSANDTSSIVAATGSPFTAPGDATAPSAPTTVTMASHLKNVSVEIALTSMPADIAGLDVDFYRTSIGGTLLKTIFLPHTTPGTSTRKHTEEFSSEAYGAVVIARARTKDFSGNVSGYTNSGAGTTLTQTVGVDSSSVTASANTSASTIVATMDSMSLTKTVGAGPCLILFSCDLRLGNTGAGNRTPVCNFRLYRGSTDLTGVLQAALLVPGSSSYGFPISLSYLDTPGAGSYTWTLKWADASGDANCDVGANYRRLSVQETKTG